MKRRSGARYLLQQFLKLEPRGSNYRLWFSMNETNPLRNVVLVVMMMSWTWVMRAATVMKHLGRRLIYHSTSCIRFLPLCFIRSVFTNAAWPYPSSLTSSSLTSTAKGKDLLSVTPPLPNPNVKFSCFGLFLDLCRVCLVDCFQEVLSHYIGWDNGNSIIIRYSDNPIVIRPIWPAISTCHHFSFESTSPFCPLYSSVQIVFVDDKSEITLMKSLFPRSFSRSLPMLLPSSRTKQDNCVSLPDYYRDTKREVYGPYFSTEVQFMVRCCSFSLLFFLIDWWFRFSKRQVFFMTITTKLLGVVFY